MHLEDGFHHVPQGCGLFPYCGAIGPVVFCVGLQEKKQPAREVEKNVGPEAEALRKGYQSFGENGQAGKPVRPFSLSGIALFQSLPSLKRRLSF